MGFNKQSYNNDYNKSNYIGVSFRVNKQTEKHIADALKAQDNIKAYICGLILADQKRKERKAGFVRSRSADRKTHLNYGKYPFEVIEVLANNDRYTVGYAETYDAAIALTASYTATTATGEVKIYQRIYDDTIGAWGAVEVSNGL